MTAADDFEPEEPWEAEIEALLAGLPAVDPPEGFVTAALDHPPLHAGRILAGLATATVLAFTAFGLSAAAPRAIIPEIDVLTTRHVAARADVLSGSGEGSSGGGEPGGGSDSPVVVAGVDDWVVAGVEPPVSLPDGYEREAGFAVDELRQAVYAHNGAAVSVFVQPGRVDWSRLPAAGRHEVGGISAWGDEREQVTVLEVGDEVVTVVGLPTDEVDQLVAGLPEADPTVEAGIAERFSTVARQLGLSPGG